MEYTLLRGLETVSRRIRNEGPIPAWERMREHVMRTLPNNEGRRYVLERINGMFLFVARDEGHDDLIKRIHADEYEAVMPDEKTARWYVFYMSRA